MTEIVAGTCIYNADLKAGVLLRGPSGSGKSDLALRLVHEGWQLVSDDQVIVEEKAGKVFCTPPENIDGMMEVRGLGIVKIPATHNAPLCAVIDLIDADQIERMPDKSYVEIVGVHLPRFGFYAFETSAPAKLYQIARAAISPEILVE